MPLSTNATTTRRTGFTLIELLVVIAIIAVLVSLLMAGVQRVRVLGPQTENGSRIQQIHDAIGRCKSDLKLSYIPAQPISGGGFTLKRSYGSSDLELDILLRAFPNMSLTDNGLPAGWPAGGVVLDANQTLCLFLTGGTATNFTGFSQSPTQPFLTGGSNRKGPWIEPNTKFFAAASNGHAWLIDVYGNPYAYFAAVDGKQGAYSGQTFQPTGQPVALNPYTSTAGVMNATSYQIISAGRDKLFGGGGALPATGPGEDNQSNFSKFLLGGRLD